MLGVLLLFWSIAFWKALESIYSNSSLTIWLLIISWSQTDTCPLGCLSHACWSNLSLILSTERSIKPSVDINNTLLKRMHARERAPAPQPPPIIPSVVPGYSSTSSASFDPYLAFYAQLWEHNLEMSAHFQWLERRVDNDLQHICASIRYL